MTGLVTLAVTLHPGYYIYSFPKSVCVFVYNRILIGRGTAFILAYFNSGQSLMGMDIAELSSHRSLIMGGA